MNRTWALQRPEIKELKLQRTIYCLLDSDDLWLPNKLEVQVKWMEEKTFIYM